MKLALLVLGSFALPISARSQVLIVEPEGTYPQISDAVAAASDGDTILVRPGLYDAFTVVGKSLVIQGDPTADVFNLILLPFFPGIPGPAVTVQDLGFDQEVTLRNLDITLSYAEPLPALLVSGCSGAVVVEDCVMTASQGRGMTAVGSASVTCTGSTFLSEGPFLPAASSTFEPNAGVGVLNASVYLYDCTSTGSNGYDLLPFVAELPSDGGPGALVSGGFLFASGSQLIGGDGGDYDEVLGGSGCEMVGDGGAGLWVDQPSSKVYLLDTTPVGGDGGMQVEASCPFPDGQAGPAQEILAGTVTPIAGDAHSFSWDSPVRELNVFEARYSGTPGNLSYLVLSSGISHGFFFQGQTLGIHFDLLAFEWAFRGPLPPSGSFAETFVLPPIPGALPSAQLVGQVVYVAPGPQIFTSGPSGLTMVDASF